MNEHLNGRVEEARVAAIVEANRDLPLLERVLAPRRLLFCQERRERDARRRSYAAVVFWYGFTVFCRLGTALLRRRLRLTVRC